MSNCNETKSGKAERVSHSLRNEHFPQVRLGFPGDGNRAGCGEKFYEHGWMVSRTQWT